MVGILDKKKTSELLIQINDTTYEKINPETLAEVVSVKESVDENVQEHIENRDIHFSKSDYENFDSYSYWIGYCRGLRSCSYRCFKDVCGEGGRKIYSGTRLPSRR